MKLFHIAASFAASAVSVIPVVLHAQEGPATQPAARAANAVPTMDDLRTAMNNQAYPEALRIANRLLAQQGPAAAALNKFEITMIKGDAQVALKAVSSAVSTYLAARKETIDPHEKALAYWTSELFRRANAQTYTAKVAPVGGKRGTFNLIDPGQRKAAMGALLDECLVLIDPDLKTAQRSQKLADIFPMLQRIADLDQLDVVVNGNDDRTEGLSNALLDHARTLLSSALKTDWTRVNEIDQRANATINVPVSQWVNGVYVQQNIAQKAGLTEGNRTELNNIISVCGKIRDAANTFLPYASNDKDWTVVLNDALRVSGKAGDVLNADYGGSYGTPDTYGQNIPTNYPGEYPVQSQNIQLPQSQSSNGRKPAATQPATPADATPTTPATPSTPAKTPARPAPVKPIPKSNPSQSN